jgi:hypothetical protein
VRMYERIFFEKRVKYVRVTRRAVCESSSARESSGACVRVLLA